MKLLVIAVALVVVFAIVRLVTKKKDQKVEPVEVEPQVKFLKEDAPVAEQKQEVAEAPKKVLVVKSKPVKKEHKSQPKIVEAKAPAKAKKVAQAPAKKTKAAPKKEATAKK